MRYELLWIAPTEEEEGNIIHAIGVAAPVLAGVQSGVAKCLVKASDSYAGADALDLEQVGRAEAVSKWFWDDDISLLLDNDQVDAETLFPQVGFRSECEGVGEIPQIDFQSRYGCSVPVDIFWGCLHIKIPFEEAVNCLLYVGQYKEEHRNRMSIAYLPRLKSSLNHC